MRRTYTPGGARIDGVAELHFRTRADFEDRFYDSDAGKAVIRADVAKFIGRSGISPTLMRELPLRTPAELARLISRGARARRRGVGDAGDAARPDARGTARRAAATCSTFAGPSSQSSRPTRRWPPRSSAARAIGVSSSDPPSTATAHGDVGVAEHREVEVERLDDRRRTPQRLAAAEVAARGEVELHERARRAARPRRAYARTTRRNPGSKIAMLGPSPRARHTSILYAMSANVFVYT